MKKGLLYLLFLSYLTVILKPVLPTVSDTIAHIFWYSGHMATVHYEHGKYHVHYEYQEAAKKTHPEKDTSLPKSEVSVNEHTPALAAYHFTLPVTIASHFFTIASHLPRTYLYIDFPPPKA